MNSSVRDRCWIVFRRWYARSLVWFFDITRSFMNGEIKFSVIGFPFMSDGTSNQSFQWFESLSPGSRVTGLGPGARSARTGFYQSSTGTSSSLTKIILSVVASASGSAKKRTIESRSRRISRSARATTAAICGVEQTYKTPSMPLAK